MKNFNLVLKGVGGQGIITLLSIIDQAALIEGLDVKSSELHGLSQRGGSVETHARFGKKVYSPLIKKGSADLVIGLEMLEGVRGITFAGPDTKFLINKNLIAFQGSLNEAGVTEHVSKIKKYNLYIVPASQICKEKLQKEVVSGIYLLGYAVYKNLIPLKAESVLAAIKNVVPEKYLDLNIQAFNLAKND